MQAIKIIQEIGFWGWVEVFAAFLVTIGCTGELWIELNKLTQHIDEYGKNLGPGWTSLVRIDSVLRLIFLRLKVKGRKISEAKEHLLERFCITLVVLGVGLELLAIPFSLWESASMALDLKSQNLTLEKQLTKAKLELARINDRTSPMHIPDNRRTYGINLLSKFDATPVSIDAIADDANASIFADELAAFLRAANWSVVGTVKGFFSGPAKTGVAIQPYGQMDIRAAASLETFLNDSGIPCTLSSPATSTNSGLQIYIMRRP